MNTILDFGYGLAHLVRNPHWNEKSHTPRHSQDVKNMSHQIFENSSCFCCQDAAVPLWPLEKTAISSSLASLKTHSYEENIVYSSLLFSLSCQSINCSGLSLQSTWKMNRTSGLDRVLQDMNPCLNKICSALSTAKSETDPQSKQWHNTIGQLPLLLSRCRSSALQSRGSTFCIVFFRIPPMSATQATKCDIWINNWTFIVIQTYI